VTAIKAKTAKRPIVWPCANSSWLGVVLVLAVSACAPEEVRLRSGADQRADREPQPGRAVHGRQLVVDAPAAGEPDHELPDVHGRAEGAARRLPNIHVAVVSSDMGAGDGDIAGCYSTGGGNGVFQYTARGTCTATNLQPGTRTSPTWAARQLHGRHLERVHVHRHAGRTGCGFEHQFASVLRALGADGQAAPVENQGFLRSDALLAIVMLTNEDDCSSRGPANLYDATSTSCCHRSSVRRRTSVATSSATSATACLRCGRRPTTTSPRWSRR
jgi:hypothetical protein